MRDRDRWVLTDVAEEFLAALVQRAEELRMGPGMNERRPAGLARAAGGHGEDQRRLRRRGQPLGAGGHGFGYDPELLDEMTHTKVVHLSPLP